MLNYDTLIREKGIFELGGAHSSFSSEIDPGIAKSESSDHESEMIPFDEKLTILAKMHAFIKQTPLHRIELPNSNTLYIKDEGYYNLSVKMRSVIGMFVSGIINDSLRYNTTVVESSSGNTAIAEAYLIKNLLKNYNIKFKAIIDSRISSNKNMAGGKCKGDRIMELASETEVLHVTSKDPSGIYSRLKRVLDYQSKSGVFVPDQYDNIFAIFGSYFYLAKEIEYQLNEYNVPWRSLDYIVNAVSTGAHSIGLGLCSKEKNPDVKLIGVEQMGSGILCDPVFINKEKLIPFPYLVGGAGHRFPTLNIVRSLKEKGFWHQCAKVSDSLSFHKCFEYRDKYDINIGPSAGMTIAVAEDIAANTCGKNYLTVIPDNFKDYSYLDTWDKINNCEEGLIRNLGGLDYRKLINNPIVYKNIDSYETGMDKYKKSMEYIRSL